MPQPWIPRVAILLLTAATVLGTGCSDSTAPGPRGSLQLTVSGLPGAAAAAITVTGPEGYSHIVTGTTTLTALAPGSYTIAALNVFASNATYGPAQASQMVSVVADTAAATASVPYAVLPSGWATKASMSTPRNALAGAGVNGVLYAVGGLSASAILASLEAYDPATNTWTAKAAMPTVRADLAVGVVNGVLYAIGGDNESGVLTAVEAYDPATNTWTTKAPMPTARAGLAVGVVNGVLYAVGGMNTAIMATVEAYDPATNRWTTKAPMPTARLAPAVGVVNGVLYAVGGSGPDSSLATVEAYDPATNLWTAKTLMPAARDRLGIGVVNGVLYAVGGFYAVGVFNGYKILATVETYDPATNTWTAKAAMPTPRDLLAVGVVNGVLYAVGGENGSVNFASVEAYTP
jgi:N-acetylneuraminic acid mutarotase